MTAKVYELGLNNRVQVLREADVIRSAVSEFNKKSPIYKINKLVLASHKLSSLYGGDDTIYVSFKTLDKQGYKDEGFVLQGTNALNVEVHRAQAQNAFDSVKELLNEMMETKILKFEPLINLETSNFFKKNVAKEIYNTKSYKSDVPLEISWISQKDFFESQQYDYKIEILKKRVSAITENKGLKNQ